MSVTKRDTDRLVRLVPTDIAPSPTHETTLLALLESGGVKAAGAWLVREYARDVYALCRAVVRDRDTAEDLAHDAFARALGALLTYRGEASPRTWLLTIARHRCFDHLRAKKRERTLIFESDAGGDSYPSNAPLMLDDLVSAESLRRALESLDEGDRALVVLRHAHAMDYAALADVFGTREGTVRMRLSRATARMRAALEDEAVATGIACDALDMDLVAGAVSREVLAPPNDVSRGPRRAPATPASIPMAAASTLGAFAALRFVASELLCEESIETASPVVLGTALSDPPSSALIERLQRLVA